MYQPDRKTGEATCESCGGPFSCGASLSGCWCAGLALSKAVLEELRGRFDSCLCRACLKAYAARDAEAVSGAAGPDLRGTDASRPA